MTSENETSGSDSSAETLSSEELDRIRKAFWPRLLRGAIYGVLIGFVVVVAGYAAWGLGRIFATEDPVYVWSVIGESLKNLSGVAAVIGGLLTFRVLGRTNKSRAEEAAENDFREHLQWAMEHTASEHPSERTFARAVLKAYAEDKEPRSPRSQKLAQEVWDSYKDMENLSQSSPGQSSEATEGSPGTAPVT